MILLDTDHLTALVNLRHSAHGSLKGRLEQSREQPIAVPIVGIEEQLRGWLAQIHRLKSVHKQVPAYDRLANLVAFLRNWEVVPFETSAADEFERLRKQKIRIGTQDLKIASIALVHNALLLSANLRDFRRVSGLRVESWLD